MSASSPNPYQQWLGIVGDKPSNHYQLLALSLFEDRPHIIQQQFELHYATVRKYQVGQYEDAAHALLDELSSAFHCLTDVESKTRYDDQLRKSLGIVTTVEGVDSVVELEVAEPTASKYQAINQLADYDDQEPIPNVLRDSAGKTKTDDETNGDGAIEFEQDEIVTPRQETPSQAIHRTRTELAQYTAASESCYRAICWSERYRKQSSRWITVLCFQQWCRERADDLGSRIVAPLMLMAVSFVMVVLVSIATSATTKWQFGVIGAIVAVFVACLALLAILMIPADERVTQTVDRLLSRQSMIDERLAQDKAHWALLEEYGRRTKEALADLERRETQLRMSYLLALDWRRFHDRDLAQFLAEMLSLNGYGIGISTHGSDIDLVAFRNGIYIAIRATGYPHRKIGSDVISRISQSGRAKGYANIAVVTNAAFK